MARAAIATNGAATANIKVGMLGVTVVTGVSKDDSFIMMGIDPTVPLG
jgi:hypothetical protein